jgi:hypothetical protein
MNTVRDRHCKNANAAEKIHKSIPMGEFTPTPKTRKRLQNRLSTTTWKNNTFALTVTNWQQKTYLGPFRLKTASLLFHLKTNPENVPPSIQVKNSFYT